MNKIFITLLLGTLTSILVGCNRNDMTPEQIAQVSGFVTDELGNPYANILIRLTKGTSLFEDKTNLEGLYEFKEELEGTYEMTIIPPLGTTLTSPTSATLNLVNDKVKKIDFMLEVNPIAADLVIGRADIFGEIKNEMGKTPVDPQEEIYARNVFDPPLGSLHPVKDPIDQPVTLEKWLNASGEVFTTCNGNSATLAIDLKGMIPSGTYTLWLNFLNVPRRVGEFVNFGSDVVKIEPLGSGTKNVVKADAEGNIKAQITHPSCILTEEKGLVLIIDYHINGRTFGADHIPDDEDVNHMLVYYQ